MQAELTSCQADVINCPAQASFGHCTVSNPASSRGVVDHACLKSCALCQHTLLHGLQYLWQSMQLSQQMRQHAVTSCQADAINGAVQAGLGPFSVTNPASMGRVDDHACLKACVLCRHTLLQFVHAFKTTDEATRCRSRALVGYVNFQSTAAFGHEHVQ